MEYEIADEDVLFDDSANPSQKPRRRQAVHNQDPPHPRDSAGAHWRGQKAEFIPEEDNVPA